MDGNIGIRGVAIVIPGKSAIVFRGNLGEPKI